LIHYYWYAVDVGERDLNSRRDLFVLDSLPQWLYWLIDDEWVRGWGWWLMIWYNTIQYNTPYRSGGIKIRWVWYDITMNENEWKWRDKNASIRHDTQHARSNSWSVTIARQRPSWEREKKTRHPHLLNWLDHENDRNRGCTVRWVPKNTVMNFPQNKKPGEFCHIHDTGSIPCTFMTEYYCCRTDTDSTDPLYPLFFFKYSPPLACSPYWHRRTDRTNPLNRTIITQWSTHHRHHPRFV